MNNFSVERLWFPEGEGTGTPANDTYLLSMAESGGTFIEWSSDERKARQRRRVVSGDLWVLPPRHSWWTRREGNKTCLQAVFSVSWLQETVPFFALPLQEHLRDTLAVQMLRTLADTAALPQNPTTQFYQESLATTLVSHLLMHYGQAESAEDSIAPLSAARLRAVTQYVSERLAEPIALTDLARLCGLHSSQFSARFRKTTGLTPHRFVTQLRIEKARELLLAGEHSPATVAVLTGFADQAHLTRHVRRAFGTTPRALQKQ